MDPVPALGAHTGSVRPGPADAEITAPAEPP